MGKIFRIQKFSVNDGPGIRTTVFFKGCNLICVWCHNPESQCFEKQMMFYQNNCTACGKCKEVCPHALKKCDFCGNCALYCPNNAREICGMEMTIEEVFAEISKDKIFYMNSDGGVTFSGGECMLQIDFLEKILRLCKDHHIHTAVDTAGNVPYGYFEKILPYTDLFLYDIKLIDNEKHKEYTGVSNDLILGNLQRLFKHGVRVWIRVPVIGGVNDSAKDRDIIKSYLDVYHPERIEFLPYNSMGEHKYKALGRNFEHNFSVGEQQNRIKT